MTLCDNVTQLVIAGLEPGMKPGCERAFLAADAFMSESKRRDPGANWTNDQRLRAMEAYILAQRSGKAIKPGKH